MHIAVLLLFAYFLALDPISTASATDFSQWLADLRQEAQTQGISSSTLDAALDDLSPLESVLQLDRRQPEKTKTLRTYLTNVLPPTRVSKGQRELEKHRELLERIAIEYQVQPRFIIALWAIESDFGRNMGKTPVVGALATLAYGSRRRNYFRRELLVALSILDEGHISPAAMVGSWAGAMGQCQFMPWNYKRRAVDFDGDGRRDIWHSKEDIFASIANFLRSDNWHFDQTWGREVLVPAHIDKSMLTLKTRKSLRQWQALGIRRLNGKDLPTRELEASLIRPKRAGGKTYLIYDNYRTLLQWNNSHFFAIAVGSLSDRISR